MFDTFKPGQLIKCTLTSTPRAEGNHDTVQRLMRMDPAAAKSLRRAQKLRRQRMVIYNRGNRDWVKREECAKVATVAKGEAWTMKFTMDVVADLKSVGKFLKVEKA